MLRFEYKLTDPCACPRLPHFYPLHVWYAKANSLLIAEWELIVLHGDSAYVCTWVTLQECNYCKHISCGCGIVSMHVQCTVQSSQRACITMEFPVQRHGDWGGYVHSNTEVVVARGGVNIGRSTACKADLAKPRTG